MKIVDMKHYTAVPPCDVEMGQVVRRVDGGLLMMRIRSLHPLDNANWATFVVLETGRLRQYDDTLMVPVNCHLVVDHD